MSEKKISKIKIPLSSDTLFSYTSIKHWNLKHHFALAEFVDNSVQSYLDNKEALKEAKKNTVQVIISSGPGYIEISDNAGGISKDAFNYAFKLSKPEVLKEEESLHEFGVGMKTASLWLGDRIEIETSAIGSNTKYTIIFDLNDILEKKSESITEVYEEYEDDFKSYTKIKITELNNPLSPANYPEYEAHLSDIYRKYLKSGELILKTKTHSSGSKPINYESPEVLKSEFWGQGEKRFIPDDWNKKTLPEFKWEKDFEFDMPSPMNFVKGRVYLLKKASEKGNNQSGIVIFRRKRAVLGSGKSSAAGDPRYRPPEIFTRARTEVFYKTLCVEVEVSANTLVSNSKTLRWVGDEGQDLEEEFISKLKKIVEGDGNAFKQLIKDGVKETDPRYIEAMPFKIQGQNYRRQKAENTPISADLKKRFAKEALEETAPIIKKFDADEILKNKDLKDTPKKDLSSSSEVIEEEVVPLEWSGKKYKMKVRVVDKARDDWYDYSYNSKNNTVGVSISLEHPFTKKFLDSKGRVLNSHVRFAAGLALAEILASKTKKSPERMRLILNKFLKEDLI